MNPTQLTEHFYLEEFTQSDYALRHGIRNIPSPKVKQNLQVLANGLEQVRDLLGNPIFIKSGYRGIDLNRAIGGVTNSAHVTGYAADFVCHSYGTPEQITDAIMKSDIEYDQLICEGTWVHISFDPKQRNQTLRALFDQRGKATYTVFV